MVSQLISLPLAANIALFAILSGGIWYAGSRLTIFADILSDRLDLAKSTMGLVFLALATSLPEVATTVTAAIEQNADLVLNNLIGGIALQTAMLALADYWAQGAISNYPRKTNHALEAALLVILFACLQVIIILGEPLAVWDIGLGSILIGVIYVGTILLLRQYDGTGDWVPVDLPSDGEPVHSAFTTANISEISTRQLLILSLGACFGILVLGTGLVFVAEAVAQQSGLGSGFIGVVFLALATSLPELSTTITAVRMGAYTMAISNIFGSNLIMMVLVLPADILYRQGPILQTNSSLIPLSISVGLLVTAIYLTGLIVRRKPRIGRLGVDSVAVLVVYFASLFLFYQMR